MFNAFSYNTQTYNTVKSIQQLIAAVILSRPTYLTVEDSAITLGTNSSVLTLSAKEETVIL